MERFIEQDHKNLSRKLIALKKQVVEIFFKIQEKFKNRI